ncbi:MAG: hypothetical protein ABIP51_22675 [Bacteroidia bacterium]
MGYTQHEVDLIKKYLPEVKSVLDFGSQNLYICGESNPPFVSTWYDIKGITDYTCIDLAGDNNALKLNWSYPIEGERQYDLIVDSGSGEHSAQSEEYTSLAFHEGYINSVYPKGELNIAQGFYECWKNKHNFCKLGGLIISINPLTGNWPNHCYNWLGFDFYTMFSEITDYKILEQGIQAAMGNTVDGYNLWSVLRKTTNYFPDFDLFSTLPIFKK